MHKEDKDKWSFASRYILYIFFLFIISSFGAFLANIKTLTVGVSSHPVKTVVFLLNKQAATLLANLHCRLHQKKHHFPSFFFSLRKLHLGRFHKTLGKNTGWPRSDHVHTCTRRENMARSATRLVGRGQKRAPTMQISSSEITQSWSFCLFHLCRVCDFFLIWGVFCKQCICGKIQKRQTLRVKMNLKFHDAHLFTRLFWIVWCNKVFSVSQKYQWVSSCTSWTEAQWMGVNPWVPCSTRNCSDPAQKKKKILRFPFFLSTYFCTSTKGWT